jgi:hypothetical protein
MSCPIISYKISYLCMHYKKWIVVFICGLLSSTVGTADCTTLSDSVTDESQVGTDLEGSSCGLIAFAWRQKYTCGCHTGEVDSSSILCILPEAKLSTFLEIDQLVPAASFTEGNQQGVLSLLILVS